MSLEARLQPIFYPVPDIVREQKRFALLQDILNLHGGKLETHYQGNLNDVLVVRSKGRKEVLKIPRDDEIYNDGANRNGGIRREAALAALAIEASGVVGDVRIPRALSSFKDIETVVPVLATEYLPGMLALRYTLYAKRKRLPFGPERKKPFGHQLGRFMLRQMEVIDPDLFLRILNHPEDSQNLANTMPGHKSEDRSKGRYGLSISHLGNQPLPESSWEHRIKNTVNGWSNPNYPATSDLLASLYRMWSESRPSPDERPRLIHGDLHFGNMLVNNKFDLTGVFDYGEAGVGRGSDALAQELSTPSLMFHTDIRQACMQTLGPLAPSDEAVSLWFSLKLGHTIPAWLDREKRGFMHHHALADFINRHPEVSKELAWPKHNTPRPPIIL